MKGRPHPEAGLQISLEKTWLVLLDGGEVHWVAQARAGPQWLGRRRATPQGTCKLSLVGRCAEGVGTTAGLHGAEPHRKGHKKVVTRPVWSPRDCTFGANS